VNARAGKGAPDDRNNGRWGSENVSRRETEDSIPGIDQSVLPPIVSS